MTHCPRLRRYPPSVMNTWKLLLCSVSFAIIAPAQESPTKPPDTLDDLLKKGLFAEEASRELDAATRAYEELIRQFDQQRRIAATAIFRLAEVKRKQGDQAAATALYQRVMVEFRDEEELIKLAEANLRGMGIEPQGNGQTPLSADPEMAELQRAKKLLQDSPDAMLFTDKGTPTLLLAAEKGWLRLAEFLIEHGARLDFIGDQEYTPLHAAASAGHLKMVQFLLSKGAPVDAVGVDVLKYPKTMTALSRAVETDRMQVVKELIAHKADLNLGAPLAKARTLDMLRLLLDAGADANQSQGAALANSLSDLERVKLLLAHGADPKIVGGGGRTPLHELSLGEFSDHSIEIGQMLLDAGSPVNERDEAGKTPLDYAVERNPAFAAFLIEHGADPGLCFGHHGISTITDAMRDLLVNKGWVPRLQQADRIIAFNSQRFAAATWRSQTGEAPAPQWADLLEGQSLPQLSNLVRNPPQTQSAGSPNPPGTGIDWSKVTIRRKTGETFETIPVNFLAAKHASSLPQLHWGDVVVFSSAPQGNGKDDVPPDVQQMLRRSLQRQITISLGGEIRQFTMRGDATVYDPVNRVLPWWSVGKICKMLMGGRVPDKAVVTIRSHGADGAITQLSLSESEGSPPLEGYHLELPAPAEDRHSISLTVPGFWTGMSVNSNQCDATLLEFIADFLDHPDAIAVNPDWAGLQLRRRDESGWKVILSDLTPLIEAAKNQAMKAEEIPRWNLRLVAGDEIVLPLKTPDPEWTGLDSPMLAAFQKLLSPQVSVSSGAGVYRPVKVIYQPPQWRFEKGVWVRVERAAKEGQVTNLTVGALIATLSADSSPPNAIRPNPIPQNQAAAVGASPGEFIKVEPEGGAYIEAAARHLREGIRIGWSQNRRRQLLPPPVYRDQR